MKKALPDTPLFAIPQVIPCRVVARINRFALEIEIGGDFFRAHINNTGRLHEILIKGRMGYCFKTPHTVKTKFRLFAVEEKSFGALIDTQFQMKAFETAFQKNLVPWLKDCFFLMRNARLGKSLIDYFFECKGNPVYLEVKSAVLREGRYAMYPDCPSLRGQRHVKDLIEWTQKGGVAFVLFMAALPRVDAFKPNRPADTELYDLLERAGNSGVGLKAMGLYFNPADSFLYLYDPNLDVIIGR